MSDMLTRPCAMPVRRIEDLALASPSACHPALSVSSEPRRAS